MTAATIGGVIVRGARGDYRPASAGWKTCTRCGFEWRGSLKAKSSECSSCRRFRVAEALEGVPCEFPELAAQTAYRQGCGCGRCSSWKRDYEDQRIAELRARRAGVAA